MKDSLYMNDSVFSYTVHVCMNVYKNNISVFPVSPQFGNKQTKNEKKNINSSRI